VGSAFEALRRSTPKGCRSQAQADQAGGGRSVEEAGGRLVGLVIWQEKEDTKHTKGIQEIIGMSSRAETKIEIIALAAAALLLAKWSSGEG